MSCKEKNPVIGIIMGSESDMPAMEPCMKQLDEFGVPYEVKVASAHRKPAEVHEWASTAHERGIRVINLARGEIVQDDAMIPALETGRVAAYITDFPNNRLLAAPHVVAMPHLGASTPESEQNCAVMAADELKDYLETGNVRNSVNLPAVSMTPSGVMRLCILHKNVPGMLANITTLFGRDGVNVENLSNKSKGDWAYTMVDLAAHIGDDVLQDVRAMEHVVRVRAINW